MYYVLGMPYWLIWVDFLANQIAKILAHFLSTSARWPGQKKYGSVKVQIIGKIGYNNILENFKHLTWYHQDIFIIEYYILAYLEYQTVKQLSNRSVWFKINTGWSLTQV